MINFADKTKILRLRRALVRFVDHTKLLTGRWPCPDCGRANAEADLLQVKLEFENDQIVWTGCWRCNMESVLYNAEETLKQTE